MKNFEPLLWTYFHYLDDKGRWFNLVIGLLCAFAVGAFDILSPDTVKQSYFYLLPIVFVSWFSGKRAGAAISLLCTVLWSVNNVNDNFIITVWNISTTIVFFLSVVFFLNKTRTMWENERALSRTDPLTGARNLRAFTELAEHEMLRSQRDGLPFSLAYFDLDNFKAVNDTFGHTIGDKLLKMTVDNMVRNLRRTDIVGRLGGDEFAIFFPETDQASVRVVLEKVLNDVNRQMEEMEWATTFSMGVITCNGGVYHFAELIKSVDALMYEAKEGGKNNIRYALHSGSETPGFTEPSLF